MKTTVTRDQAVTMRAGMSISQNRMSSPTAHGCSQRAVSRPAQLKTPFQRVVWQLDQTRPFSDRASFAAKLHDMIRARVVGLLGECGPAAVLRRVIAIDTDAVQGVSRRAAAHVRKECREALAPPRAHRDAATAVVFVTRLLGIEAARDRSAPRSIFAAAALTMSRAAFGAGFIVKTSTTPRRAATQTLFEDRCRTATQTEAVPRDAPVESRLWCRAPLHRQASERQPLHTPKYTGESTQFSAHMRAA